MQHPYGKLIDSEATVSLMPKHSPVSARTGSVRCVPMVLLILLLAIASRSCTSQSVPDMSEGVIPNDAYSYGDIDAVSMTSGNLLLHIPLLSYPQRGNQLKLSFSINYSNHGWTTKPATQGPNKQVWVNQGFTGPAFALEGLLNGYSATVDVPDTSPAHPMTVGLIYESDGSAHTVEDGMTIDATGIAVVNGGVADKTGVRTIGITDPDPNFYYAEALEDTDGNEITQTSSGWTDTVGRTFPGTVIQNPNTMNGVTNEVPPGPPFNPVYELMPGEPTSNLSSCPSGTQTAYIWNVPAPSGSTVAYTFCYETIGYTSDFGESGITEGAGSCQVIVAIVLPNQTSWQFGYDSWGEISSVTYPTGAVISYTWETEAQERAVATRALNPGNGGPVATWSYSWNPSSAFNVVTAPPDGNGVSNDTAYTYTGGSEVTQVQYYSGSHTTGTLLKTITKSYGSTTSPYSYLGPSFSANINVVPTSVTTSWPTGQSSKVVTTYDSGFTATIYVYDTETGETVPYSNQVIYGLPVLKQEYDYGASSPTRQTATTYEWQNNTSYLTANLLTLPASVVTENSSGSETAGTTYTYDEATYLTSSGISVQASPPDGIYRGHPTTVTKWLSSGTSPVAHTNWYDTGEIYEQIDPLQHTTATYGYSTTYGGSLPTTLTDAAGDATSYSYDLDTGRLVSETDPNLETTTYSYSDPLFRLKQVNYPDGGETTYTYNDTASPVNVQMSRAISASTTLQQQYVVDGFGRLTVTNILTDPAGANSTTTTYDGPGRVATVSNPYRSTSDPTYGVTTYSYDGLNRKVSQLNPDKTMETWQYSGNEMIYTDEDGNEWQDWYDGLGRLYQVWEPNGAQQTASMETVYTYDTLNDLLSVVQNGPSGDTARNRSFTYDNLSRLLSAMNPEAGMTSYTYDADGNVLTRTDARGITTSYTYDVANRVLSKSYSEDPYGSPWSCYEYGSTALQGNGGNQVGRLINEWTQGASGGSCAAAPPSSGNLTLRSLSYDPMGRIWSEQQCTPAGCYTSTACANGHSYGYDLAGDLTCSTDGIPNTPGTSAPLIFTNAFDGADRLQTVTSSWNDPTHPQVLFSDQAPGSTPPCGATAPYAPFGGLQNAAYGNGLIVNKGYDNRMRPNCESDTGNIVTTP
jgi:YD repeat-containing protein